MADRHDTRYKKLFSHPELVREVLESFVHEDFVRQLDWTRMTRIDKSFVNPQYRKKESDLIWQIPLSGKASGDSLSGKASGEPLTGEAAGEPFYLYLLLEFQSTVDRFLALRMLHYLCEFYEYLRKTTRPRLKFLPPVFPLLIYNGEREWTAPLELRELIRPQLAVPHLPSFRYFPLIEKDIPDTELLSLKNAVAAVFYLEKSSPAEMVPRLRDLGQLLGRLAHPLRELLKGWFLDYLQYLPERERNCSILEETIPEERDENMLETAIKGYVEIERKKAIAEGRAKGMAEGKAEGIAEGIAVGKTEGEARGILIDKQQTLIRQLDRKFGITEDERARVAGCTDPDRLNAALDEILDADAAAKVLEKLQ